jgi:hypothetical protein
MAASITHVYLYKASKIYEGNVIDIHVPVRKQHALRLTVTLCLQMSDQKFFAENFFLKKTLLYKPLYKNKNNEKP